MESDLHVEIAARLKRDGQRYTRNRRALVEILRDAKQPQAIPDILRAEPELPQSSAYRNLTVLERSHVVRRVVTGEDFAHFELVEDLTEHHHHLVCSNCGRVEDVQISSGLEQNMEQALDAVADRAGFRTVSHRLDLVGTCRNCA